LGDRGLMSISTRVLLLVALLAIATVLGLYHQPGGRGGGSSTVTIPPHPRSSAEPNSAGVVFCGKDVKERVTAIINKARREAGVPPVKLVDLGLAQGKLAEMIDEGYFGHCNPRGLLYPLEHPGIVYYYVEENIGMTVGHPLQRFLLELARNHVYSMIYNDEAEHWGHRDSLLDPTNNLVDIACGVSGNRFYLVIYMLKAWINWTAPPHYDKGMVSAEGRVTLQSSSLVGVSVYEYKAPHVLSWPVKSGVEFTCQDYSIGMLYAVVGRGWAPGMGARVIEPAIYEVHGGWFHVSFPLPRPPNNSTYYVVVFWVKNTLGVKHPYDPSRYREEIPVGMLVVGGVRGFSRASEPLPGG